MFKDSYRTEKWSDKIKVWFSRPKWRPAAAEEKFPVTKNDLSAFQKYDPKINLTSKLYGFGQLAFASSYSMLVFFNFAELAYFDLFLTGVFVPLPLFLHLSYLKTTFMGIILNLADHWLQLV